MLGHEVAYADTTVSLVQHTELTIYNSWETNISISTEGEENLEMRYLASKPTSSNYERRR